MTEKTKFYGIFEKDAYGERVSSLPKLYNDKIEALDELETVNERQREANHPEIDKSEIFLIERPEVFDIDDKSFDHIREISASTPDIIEALDEYLGRDDRRSNSIFSQNNQNRTSQNDDDPVKIGLQSDDASLKLESFRVFTVAFMNDTDRLNIIEEKVEAVMNGNHDLVAVFSKEPATGELEFRGYLNKKDVSASGFSSVITRRELNRFLRTDNTNMKQMIEIHTL